MSMITVKGQVTIPQALRKKFHLQPGDEIEFLSENGRLVLRRKTQTAKAVRAWAKQAIGAANTGLSTDQIMKLTRGED